MDIIINALATLAAAFLGAFFAFIFQERKEGRKIRTSNIAAGNRAMFLLSQQFNELSVIQKQIIEPARKHPVRFVVMRPSPPLNYESLRFEVNTLSFLLETKHRQVLMDLLIEEGRFHAAVQALNERSKVHLSDAQPVLDKAGIEEGGDYSISQLKEALGNRLFVQLSRATDEMIDYVDSSIKSLLQMGDKLYEVLRELYPGKTFIRFRAT
jgi:hypothetical protein